MDQKKDIAYVLGSWAGSRVGVGGGFVRIMFLSFVALR